MSESSPDVRDRIPPLSKYPPQACQFIREGLAHTVKMVHGEAGDAEDESRHVNGQQLCLGLRDYAVRRYGLLARTVLRNWNIHTTEDFGRLVFSMIEAQLMRKTDEDRLEHFQGVFDFDEAFGDLPARR
ncbi:MAG: hypothetical protein IT433_07360 [Phycisphaerales bacterium]|nr:hypothetical protein [Phycisphaerales bacterium]